MAWTATESILLSSDWQYTEPIASGSFFRLKHTEAPNGGLFVIAQCEVDEAGKLSLIDSQILAVEKLISDVIRLPKPGCFTERRIAIKKLPRQPSLQEELRRLILPGFLQPVDEDIRLVSRSKWSIEVEVSDFVELTTSSGTGTTTPPPTTTTNTKTLTYASDGDTNGVCYWIGTNYGIEAWTNPHIAGRVTCAMSTSEGGTVANSVDRINNNSYTENLPNSWKSIDLGATNKLVVKHYVLQKWSGLNRAIRNWKLQGSNNVISNSVADLNAATWIDLDVRVNDLTMTDDPYSYGNYAVTGSEAVYGYRWFRILQTGLNANDDHYLMISEFEFYGTLTKV